MTKSSSEPQMPDGRRWTLGVPSMDLPHGEPTHFHWINPTPPCQNTCAQIVVVPENALLAAQARVEALEGWDRVWRDRVDEAEARIESLTRERDYVQRCVEAGQQIVCLGNREQHAALDAEKKRTEAELSVCREKHKRRKPSAPPCAHCGRHKRNHGAGRLDHGYAALPPDVIGLASRLEEIAEAKERAEGVADAKRTQMPEGGGKR